MHNAPETLGVFTTAVTRSLAAFRDALPNPVLVTKDEFLQLQNRQAALTVPAREVIGNTEQLFEELRYPLYEPEASDLRLFQGMRGSLTGTDLHGTPFHRLLDIDVPFALPDEARFSGHWIVSPPGRGKTTLLHAMVMEDIRSPNASLILMDSKGDLIEPIRALTDIQDRLIIIDPDPQNPVAINPLDIAQTDLAQTVDLLEYLFASLLEFKMTAMQTTLFEACCAPLSLRFRTRLSKPSETC